MLALARGVVGTDDDVVDGAVRGSGRATVGLSGLLRHLQNGNAQLYVTGVLAGVLLIAVRGGGAGWSWTVTSRGSGVLDGGGVVRP